MNLSTVLKTSTAIAGSVLIVAAIASAQPVNPVATLGVGSITGLGTGVGTFLATPSSANLRAALTDESGTGVALFGSGAIGVATGTSLALAGATIGAHALAVTGTVNISGATTSGGLITATLGATIASGQALKLGNTYVNGVTVPTGSLEITDAAGNVYLISVVLKP